MDPATVVKERVLDLAGYLEASRRTIHRLQRERHDLLRQVEDAKSEVRAAREELLLDRRKRSDIQTQLSLTEQRIERLTDRLRHAEDTRAAAMSELGEATSALTDIRDQLRVSLREVAE